MTATDTGSRRGFDIAGAVLGALTLALATYALTEARTGGPVVLPRRRAVSRPGQPSCWWSGAAATP